MNLTIIADGHPREWPVLQSVSRAFPDAAWIHPGYSLPNPSKKDDSKETLSARISRKYRHFRDRVRRLVIRQMVGLPDFDFQQKIEIPWFELSQEKGLRILDGLDPDIIVTCRAPILRPEVLQKANWCGINVHFGIVPDYRGNEGLFWAATKKDVDALGGSIHLLNSGVDTGSIIAEAYPELDGTESFVSIELKVSRSLSEALVECLKIIFRQRRAPKGRAQMRAGRNYLAKERTFSKDISFFLRRLGGRSPSQKERLKFYLDEWTEGGS